MMILRIAAIVLRMRSFGMEGLFLDQQRLNSRFQNGKGSETSRHWTLFVASLGDDCSHHDTRTDRCETCDKLGTIPVRPRR